jgi:hypothetical protein
MSSMLRDCQEKPHDPEVSKVQFVGGIGDFDIWIMWEDTTSKNIPLDVRVFVKDGHERARRANYDWLLPTPSGKLRYAMGFQIDLDLTEEELDQISHYLNIFCPSIWAEAARVGYTEESPASEPVDY